MKPTIMILLLGAQLALGVNLQTVTIGTAGAGGGDSLYTAFTKINSNSVTLSGAVIGSPKIARWTTNQFRSTYGATNMMPWTVTNYAGISYELVQGRPIILISDDNGTNWTRSASMLRTNPVRVALCSQELPSALSTPIDPIITNVTIFTLVNPAVFGSTNQVYGASFRTGAPVDQDDVVNKAYCDSLFASTAWWRAATDVQLNGHSLHLSESWEFCSETPSTNVDQVCLEFLGQQVLTVKASAPIFGSIDSIWTDGGTNVFVLVRTNGLAGPPALQFSATLSPLNWTWLSGVTSSYPTLTNNEYLMSFAMPNPEMGFVRVGSASTNMTVSTFSGVLAATVLQASQFTVPSSTATTYGMGAGLVRWDANYLYISTGTNAWKRAALSAW